MSGVSAPIADGQMVAISTYGIAVDATSVYWTNSTAGTVMKVPVAGGSLTTLASGQSSPTYGGVAIDATSVYWANASLIAGGAAMRVPVAGGSPTKLVSASSPQAIAVNATSVCWTDSTLGTVMRVGICQSGICP
jgi:hypothetical protein